MAISPFAKGISLVKTEAPVFPIEQKISTPTHSAKKEEPPIPKAVEEVKATIVKEKRRRLRGAPSWGMTSVVKHELESQVSDETL